MIDDTTAETRNAQFPFVVFADFVCPWSFLAVDQVQRFTAKFGVHPIWRPHWLRPDIPPEGEPVEDTSRREASRAWLTECAPDVAVHMQFPDRIVSSFRAFEALEFAVDQSCSLAFTAAVYDALWRRSEDISRVDVLQNVAALVGLDPEALGRALADGTYIERAHEAVALAQRLEVTATPTFFLGTTRVNGWHYDEVIQQTLERQGIEPLGSA